MSDEQELKLACLHHAGGNLDHAKSLFDWVSGSVRATPQSEAPAVSAPNQDKPEQPFNYQHPSKYGTDVPRRCYLEELTPEERAIRDLVGAIEHLGAHPLLTTTVIQLMKAGESLADWVDIGLRDKAIAALTSEPETHTGGGRVGALLDEGQQETAPVQSASDQDKAYEEGRDAFQRGASRNASHMRDDLIEHWLDGWDDQASEASLNLGAVNLAPQIPVTTEAERPSVVAGHDRVDHNPPNDTEGGGGLHDPEPEPIATEVRKEAEGDAAQNWGPGINYIRECTCHPDDYPPSPCQHKYALSECREAATKAGMREYEMEDGSRLWAYVVRDFSVGVGTPVEASETLSELGSQSEPLASTEQEQESKALDQAQRAMAETEHEAGDASVFGHGINVEVDNKRSWLGLFGGKKEPADAL